jgi:hypothetical protein
MWHSARKSGYVAALMPMNGGGGGGRGRGLGVKLGFAAQQGGQVRGFRALVG